MSWDRACQLEDQLLEEVAEQAKTESLPEELERREQRLGKIKEAKAMIEQHAEKRYQAEQDEYEERTAQKTPGNPRG